MVIIHRGDIYFARLTGALGSEQDGVRPVVILQNDIGNKYSPTVIVACISTKKKGMPTHVEVSGAGLKQKSYIMLEHIKTIDKKRLIGYTGTIDNGTMKKIESAMKISLGMGEGIA